MIFVDRRSVAPPRVLIDGDLTSGGPAETARAIAFYGKASNRDKSFGFNVYKHESVRQTLERLFHGKCAYCESEYAPVHPCEIEHWRPKHEVVDGRGRIKRPAYYWLAADWENLFPSCIDCNRRRYYQITSGDGSSTRLLGKQNIFPLAPGSRRARKPGQHKKEKPALLNPCRDRPEKYLEFPSDPGLAGQVRPRCDRRGRPLYRAVTSIEVYGLCRPALVFARKKRFLEVLVQIRRLEEAQARFEECGSDKAAEVVRREAESLGAYCVPTERYSMMARQMVAAAVGL
jgi:uncharacterized protein (TIGR02646 family)